MSSVPVVFDDGSRALVPESNLKAALADGGKIAQPIQFDDGSKAYVPLDRVHDAIKDGGMLIGLAPQRPPNPILTGVAEGNRYPDIIGPGGGPGAPGEYENSLTVSPTEIAKGVGKGAAKMALETGQTAADVTSLGLNRVVEPQQITEGQERVRQALQPSNTEQEVGATTAEAAATAQGIAALPDFLVSLSNLVRNAYQGKAAGKALAELVRTGPTRTEAGKAAQAAAARVKNVAGEAVAAAKEAGVPEDFTMTLSKGSNLDKALSQISDEIGTGTGGLQSLRDPQLDMVRGVVDELGEGQLDLQQISNIRQQLNSQITRAEAGAKSGSMTGDVARHLKQVKRAFDDEYYSQLSTVVGPDKASDLLRASTEYAQVIRNQTKGPAAPIFKAKTPELVIKKLNSGAMDATTVQSYLQGMTQPEVHAIRNGALHDLLQSVTIDGKTDWAAALTAFAKQGGAAQALYGEDYTALLTGFQYAMRHSGRINFAKKLAKYAALGAVSAAGYKSAAHVLSGTK